MSIRSDLRTELIDAMKTRDLPRRDAIRSVEAEIQMRRVAPGYSGTGEDDELYRQVIGSYVKKMRKAASEYAGMGERGATMARKLSFEVEYLSRWLPSTLDEDQSRTPGAGDHRPVGGGRAAQGAGPGDGGDHEKPPPGGGRRPGVTPGPGGTFLLDLTSTADIPEGCWGGDPDFESSATLISVF